LTEAARELCEWAQTLNPEADRAEQMDMAATAVSALAGDRAPDAWLDVTMTPAGHQLRWIPWVLD